VAIDGYHAWHFNAPDVIADAEGEAEREKILINMGIAIVVPAKKISEILTTFVDEEQLELEEHERTKAALVEPDSSI
jgi:DNA polymerase III sliding clamp (beta) subunit (PCNA family)